MRSRAKYIVIVMLVAIALGVACSSPDPEARIDPGTPDLAQFKAVSPMLVHRCGSIDCHGSAYRNFRIYGFGGARLDKPDARPDFPIGVDDDEVKANYDAVVGLEPEVMRDVLNDRGARPERLTIVRKGRNDEDHEGGRRITPGDDADQCLLTWLAGSTLVAACNKASCILPDAAIGACD
jgi:hypothetical protein